MNLRAIAAAATGLLLLALAAWLVPSPRLNPRPDLPEIAPFSAADRVALFIPDPASFPPADSLGLVQRARDAGAAVRVFALGAPTGDFAPTRLLQPFSGPDTPTGYHPDQWPALPASVNPPGTGWHMLVLSPDEIAIKNQAVLAAARALRATGTDDSHGSREAALLARARRAELYIPLLP